MAKTETTKRNPPVYKSRVEAVTASVWENEFTLKDGKKVTNYSVTLDRRYLDKQSDEWKSTSSYGKNDIPNLILALEKCREWIVTRNKKEGNEDE